LYGILGWYFKSFDEELEYFVIYIRELGWWKRG